MQLGDDRTEPARLGDEGGILVVHGGATPGCVGGSHSLGDRVQVA